MGVQRLGLRGVGVQRLGLQVNCGWAVDTDTMVIQAIPSRREFPAKKYGVHEVWGSLSVVSGAALSLSRSFWTRKGVP